MYFFIDLDGVIIDSARECYKVSSTVYFGEERKTTKQYEKLFLKYRGLVLNAKEYYILHESLKFFQNGEIDDIEIFFNRYDQKNNKKDLNNFENLFFLERRKLTQKNFSKWITLNPLTKYGKYIQKKQLKNVFIVTSKNKSSSRKILDFYNIKYDKIFGADEIYKEKNKGLLIKKVIDQMNIDECVFIDDSVRNLDTCRDSRVKCYFANWGYGENTNYDLFTFK